MLPAPSEKGSDKLLPSPPRAQTPAKKGSLRPISLVLLLVLLCLAIGHGGGAGWVSSLDPVGKCTIHAVSIASLTYYMTEYPMLINATIETLSDGLAHNKFTSVSLVKVHHCLFLKRQRSIAPPELCYLDCVE